MRRPERVVHIEIAERREHLRKLRIVFLLAGPKPGVLDEGDAATRQPPCCGYTGRRIGNELDRRAEQFLQVADNLLERVLGIGAALRPAQVREQHDPRALLAQVLNRGERRAQPRVVGDLAVLERDVEVHPHQRALTVQRLRGKIPQASFLQRRFPR